MLYLWREQLALVVQLMRVSGHGLRENLGLVGAAIGIQLGLAALTLPLYLVILAALTNGHVSVGKCGGPTHGCGEVWRALAMEGVSEAWGAGEHSCGAD